MTACNQSAFGFEACGKREIAARFEGGTFGSDWEHFCRRAAKVFRDFRPPGAKYLSIWMMTGGSSRGTFIPCMV
jgi:hypothetical protein